MSWLFSQALVEEYSGDTCSDGALSVPLSGNPTQQAYCSPDKMTEFSRLSRFGMTFKPLTESLGQDVLMSYLEDFPVRTFLPLDEALASKEPDRECGVTWRESLAMYDLDTFMWKTVHSSLLEDFIEFSGTWPRWGLMQDGVSYRQQPLVPHTKEIESGSWPTPNSWDGKRGPRSAGHIAAKKAQITLVTAVARQMWPTPTAHNAKEGAYPGEFTRNTPTLSAQAGGMLNPTWVEWLMGWPLGWTDLKPLATDKYQQWLQQHGGC